MAQGMIHSAPMFSARMSTRMIIGALLFAGLTVGISMAGKSYGRRIAAGDYSASSEALDIHIGPDHLRLPENAIRFPQQRTGGELDQVNLALQWPEMEGYEIENASRFFDISDSSSLIFIQMSQSTMTRDMSGRVEPIYSRLFADAAHAGPGGLVVHSFKQGSGHGEEVLLTDPAGGGEAYAVRCILPTSPAHATGADCQRDVFAGSDLSVEYRFSSNLLKDWRKLDDAVKAYAASHVVR